jgi:hypothetical protein
MKIYMYVTNDKYELPIVMADSVKALAKMVGVKASSINSVISRHCSGDLKTCRYRSVEIEDGE